MLKKNLYNTHNFCIFFGLLDYLKNLPEDSSDYRDTQSKETDTNTQTHTHKTPELVHTRDAQHT